MADERGATIIDPTASALKAVHDALSAFHLDTHGRLSGLESGFAQMDKRLSNVERAVSQIQWSLVSGFLITILAVILTRLLR